VTCTPLLELFVSSSWFAYQPWARWSADTFFVYSDGLALNGQAPAIFTKTSRSGLPWVSVTFGSFFALIGFMSISSGPGKGEGHIEVATTQRFTLCIPSIRLVPEHDVYRRFADMVRDFCCTYLFSPPSDWDDAIYKVGLVVDLPSLPGWLGRPGTRPKPPPIQILPPTLCGMVRGSVDRHNPPPQRLLRLSSR